MWQTIHKSLALVVLFAVLVVSAKEQDGPVASRAASEPVTVDSNLGIDSSRPESTTRAPMNQALDDIFKGVQHIIGSVGEIVQSSLSSFNVNRKQK